MVYPELEIHSERLTQAGERERERLTRDSSMVYAGERERESLHSSVGEVDGVSRLGCATVTITVPSDR